MNNKELINDCLILANVQYQKARHKPKDDVTKREIKAWSHIIYLIETSY
tara:strand:+ start:4120 stop:4266 length:147 start_codon:yes stop_codon:yes gene_type:complete